MKDQSERIICAAIHYLDGNEYPHQPFNITSGYVLIGLRHCNVIITNKIITGKPTRSNNIQGFITSKNRFVDRVEAGQIALACGQIEKLSYFGSKELDSSDLY